MNSIIAYSPVLEKNKKPCGSAALRTARDCPGLKLQPP
jgi:hypothetical protein